MVIYHATPISKVELISQTNLKNMKYVDLHLHLDGAITVKIAKKLAKLTNTKLPGNNDKELAKYIHVPSDCKNLVEFLKCFELPLSLLQTKESLEEATYLVLEDMRKAGNTYVELRYAPQLHTQKDMSQEDAIKAVLKGLSRSKIKANIILCLMRGEGNEKENEETVELAKKYLVKDGGVVALDLAGAESIFPTSKYKDIFTKVKKYKIPFTIHSGESEGPEGVKLAIEYGASRIGHGVRIREDKEVVKLVKEKHIPLEMCPTSNIQTCAVKSLDDYPLLTYLSNDIKVTINTDDPAIEGTSIKKEHLFLKKHLGLTKSQQKEIVRNAIDVAFTTDEVKAKLKARIK